jgi:flagellar biosynthesis protein FlhF
MKIKRFFAPDIRKAMAMVKEELGSDAVIMSNRSVDGGVEIVAARDFDEQAVHNKLQSDIEDDNQHADSDKKPKKVTVSAFDVTQKSVHVVPSPRKKGAKGTVTPSPVRRQAADAYMGYAEKIHRASSQKRSQHIASKLDMTPHLDQLLDDSLTKKKTANKNEKAAAEVPAFQLDKLMQQMRQEIGKEIGSLKSVLDARLAEMNWHQDRQHHPVRLDLLRHLADMGFSKKLALKIANRLGMHKEASYAIDKAQEMLSRILPVSEEKLLEEGGIFALVGPTGVGKTTTIAKLAAQFILKHGERQVALITTDNYRIGAHEQINTYGRILNVPVRVASNAEELAHLIHGFKDKALVLIDTAGMSQKDMRLAEQIATLQQKEIEVKTLLVMSAATQYRVAQEIVSAFEIFSPIGCILTKLDETVTPGAMLSAIIEQQLPLAFVTNGQQVPEDIAEPDSDHLIQQCIDVLDQMAEEINDYEQWVAEGHA